MFKMCRLVLRLTTRLTWWLDFNDWYLTWLDFNDRYLPEWLDLNDWYQTTRDCYGQDKDWSQKKILRTMEIIRRQYWELTGVFLCLVFMRN